MARTVGDTVDAARSVIVRYTRAGTRYRASGFHLRGDLVLTAGHLAGADDGAYTVECSGDSFPGATLVWWAKSDAIDVGLLQVEGLPPGVNPVVLGVLDRRRVATIEDCSGLCLPTFQGGQAAQLDGYIPLGEGYNPAGAAGSARLQLTGPGPQTSPGMTVAQAWQCASGAAITVSTPGGQVCLGVVHRH